MTTLILVRHGETVWNVEGRYQGQTDVPLNEVGKAQAQQVAITLKQMTFDAIYSSDLQRAYHTAEAINRYHNLPLHSEKRLREINAGDFEGLTREEQKARDPEFYARWRNDPNIPPPNGETQQSITDRMQSLLNDLQRQHPQQTVLLVGHGGTIRAMLCLCIGLTTDKYWHFWLKNTSISEIQFTERGAIIHRLNDVGHLQD